MDKKLIVELRNGEVFAVCEALNEWAETPGRDALKKLAKRASKRIWETWEAEIAKDVQPEQEDQG